MTAARLQQCACSSNRPQHITVIMTMWAILTSQCVRNEVDVDHVDHECCHQTRSKLVTLQCCRGSNDAVTCGSYGLHLLAAAGSEPILDKGG